MFSVTNRAGDVIESVEDWRLRAAPASATHWKDGRSAEELAKAWVGGSGPEELGRLMASQTATAGLSIASAAAEAQVGFDAFPGGKRNHDLLVRGRAAGGEVVIGIEAKADETFGETLGDYQSAALARRSAGKSTNAPERLLGLARDIAGAPPERLSSLGALRYQLFSGIAGTLASVEGDAIAAFVVHEFATELTTAENRAANKRDLSRFAETVLGVAPPDDDWWLLGPFRVPAERWRDIPLYIGHLTSYPDRA